MTTNSEGEVLRERQSRWREVTLRIYRNLDLDAVQREIASGARVLTGARYSGITTLDDSGQLQDFIISGLTPDDRRRFLSQPGVQAFIDHLSKISEPVRVEDLGSYVRSVGVPGIQLPASTFLSVPIHQQRKPIAGIHLARERSGDAFSEEDEENVRLFTAHAAQAIANAARFAATSKTPQEDLTRPEEVERLRAQLLGGVYYDLSVPLTSIKGSVATLLDGFSADLDPADMLPFLRIIDTHANHMRGLLSNLVDKPGTLPLSAERTQVASLVDEARTLFLSRGVGNNIRIDLEPDLPAVTVDRWRVIQVLDILLVKASRYSHDSSVIRVTAVRDAAHVTLSITSEGEERARDTVQDSGGLAFCRGVVEAHGGRLSAGSAGPGRGVQFSVVIPLIEAAGAGPAVSSARSSDPDPTARERTRILVIDSNPQTQPSLQDTLTNAGFMPIMTAEPEEVPALLKTHEPHLALLDVVLPATDGIDLMQEILAIARIPVIFLSSYRRDQIVAEAFELGAADYILKPALPLELVARIKAALREPVGREQAEPPEPYLLKDLTIDYAQRRVTVAGRPVRLSALEYELLFELSSHAGLVMTHAQLLKRVWAERNTHDPRTVRTAVRRLRRKLGDDGKSRTYISTEPQVGYRMAKP